MQARQEGQSSASSDSSESDPELQNLPVETAVPVFLHANFALQGGLTALPNVDAAAQGASSIQAVAEMAVASGAVVDPLANAGSGLASVPGELAAKMASSTTSPTAVEAGFQAQTMPVQAGQAKAASATVAESLAAAAPSNTDPVQMSAAQTLEAASGSVSVSDTAQSQPTSQTLSTAATHAQMAEVSQAASGVQSLSAAQQGVQTSAVQDTSSPLASSELTAAASSVQQDATGSMNARPGAAASAPEGASASQAQQSVGAAVAPSLGQGSLTDSSVGIAAAQAESNNTATRVRTESAPASSQSGNDLTPQTVEAGADVSALAMGVAANSTAGASVESNRGIRRLDVAHAQAFQAPIEATPSSRFAAVEAVSSASSPDVDTASQTAAKQALEVASAQLTSKAQDTASLSESSASSTNESVSLFLNTLLGTSSKPVDAAQSNVRLSAEPGPTLPPHEVALSQGQVHVEVLKMVKEGGGRVVIELTPHDQTTFTIELSIDDARVATLRVDGASDSTRTRLEQTSEALREQFSQMGMQLQLDVRQGRSDQQTANLQDAWVSAQESGLNVAVDSSLDTVAANQARQRQATSEGRVYLYA